MRKASCREGQSGPPDPPATLIQAAPNDPIMCACRLPGGRSSHKTDGPVVASRILAIQIAEEGGPQAANSDGCEPLKRRGLKRERLLTLRGSQDRRRNGPGPVAGHVGLATRFTTVTRAGFRPAWDPPVMGRERSIYNTRSIPGSAQIARPRTPWTGRRSAAVPRGDRRIRRSVPDAAWSPANARHGAAGGTRT
jgi:hypothetical protein